MSFWMQRRSARFERTLTNHLECQRRGICFLGLSLTALMLVFAQAGYGQLIDAPGSVAPSKLEDNSCRLAGTVITSITGEPIRLAVVQISGQTNRVALTDNAGHFEFDGLAAGQVFVRATKPGFLYAQGVPYLGAVVQIAHDAPSMLLKMSPAGAIVGRVMSRDEQPLEGLQLHIISSQTVNGQQSWVNAPSQATSDENGNFRISGLNAGTYYLMVGQSQESTLSQKGLPNAREQGYAEAFYPGVSEFTAAAPIEVNAGREVEADISLAAEPMYRVAGSVSASENLMTVLVFTRKGVEDSDFTQTVQMQDGKFQVKLPAGSYSVIGFTENGVQLSTPGASVVVSSDSPDVRIALNPSLPIQVEVQTERTAGSAKPGPQEAAMMGLNLQLAPDTPFRQSYWWASQSSGIQNVKSGVYAVQVNASGTWWVKAVQSGGVDLLNDDLTIVDGAQTPPIEITLRDDAATVTGTAGSADEVWPATVLLVQPHGRRNLIKAMPAIQGKFQFQGIAPGDYSLIALDRADQLEYANPEVLNPYLSKAEHLSLQAHGTANVNLTVTPVER
jgi:Carboxypeptidase regulatory-like domain